MGEKRALSLILSARINYLALHDELGQSIKGMRLRLFLSVLDGMQDIPDKPINDFRFMERMRDFLRGNECLQDSKTMHARKLLTNWI